MEGAEHQFYRSALVKALRPADEMTQTPAPGARRLDGPGHAGAGYTPSADEFRGILARIAFDELVWKVFGIGPCHPLHDRLAREYGELGGNGLVWNIGSRQTRAFAALSALLRDHIGAIGETPSDGNSVLENLLSAGPVDAEMLGNLIYMVEMGRYDMAAFFRWLTWFAARNPAWADRIAAGGSGAPELAEAFVQEALRLEQSERLVRRAKRDFVFDGMLFPKGALLRLCIWESHKALDAHDAPFVFDPGRFLENRPGSDRYSPFGMGRHQCPFGTYSIRLGAWFVSELTGRYVIAAHEDGEPVRGLYHWEPSAAFTPVLTRRDIVQ